MPSARLALVALAAIVAACSSGGPQASSVPPGATSSAPPTAQPEAIEHATGATDVILRAETGGGFVAPSFLATQAPFFSLFGDGTVVFRDPNATSPPSNDPVVRLPGFRTAHLTEAQVQSFLEFAIRQGGLGLARADYPAPVMDAPSTVFELHAGGLEKRVTVNALGIDDPTMPDAAARKAFSLLADRLTTLDQGGALATRPYQPERYRVMLVEGFDPAGPARPWPWADITPADFVVPSEPGRASFPMRVFTASELAPLQIAGLEGGAQGISLTDPAGGAAHRLSVRPLLPDEQS